MKKILALGIILLFIGVAVAPSINFNVVKASNDNDLVEVTTQACGIKGFGDATVKLTRQQYQNLEQYLVDFRARLNQTSTRDEAVPIFKEAVVELNKYGLLPKGMNVKKAQSLVIGLFQNTKLTRYEEKLLNTSENPSNYEGNKFCLIYGEAKSNTLFLGPVNKVIYCISGKYSDIFFKYHLYNSIIGVGLLLLSLNLFYFSCFTLLILNSLRNFPYIGGIIYYGDLALTSSKEHHYTPAEGNIWTNGLYGIKQWNGSFYGNLPYLLFSLSLFQSITLYPGVNGFTGFRFHLNSSDFYFGFALNVNVSSDHP